MFHDITSAGVQLHVTATRKRSPSQEILNRILAAFFFVLRSSASDAGDMDYSRHGLFSPLPNLLEPAQMLLVPFVLDKIFYSS